VPKREVVKDEAYYLAEAQEKFQQGRYDPALRAYSKVLEYNSANPIAWTLQVRMLIELGELREAKLWAEKALQRLPNLPELLAAKAVVLARMADLDSALAFSDAAIEERGNTPYVWLARGDVLLARGEARATYCFEQALTLGRSDWVNSWQAARIHHFHRSFAIAHTYAQQAVELAPGRAVVWLQVGECETALGLGGRASESLAQARLLDPECPGLEPALKEAARISTSGSLWRRMRKIFK
jgi:tetratricopeptide (TPR) repeat protein